MLADRYLQHGNHKHGNHKGEQQYLKEHRWDKTCTGEIFLEEKVNSLSSSTTPGQRGIFYICFTDHPSRYSLHRVRVDIVYIELKIMCQYQ